MLYILSPRTPILVDDQWLPRYWAVVWSLLHGGGLAEQTLKRKLRHIEALYEHGESCGVAIDDALSALNFHSLDHALESFFVNLRNSPEPSSQVLARWNTAFHFVRDVCARIAKNPESSISRDDIHLKISRLDKLYLGLRPRKKVPAAKVRALPRNVVTEMLDKITPGALGNPFVGEFTQWRVFCLVVLLLYQGLRRGEALVLRANSLVSQRDRNTGRISWILHIPNNVPNEDPRGEAPSLKTAESVRSQPVTPTTAEIIQTYLENYRGKTNHAYLLSSIRKQPLSLEGVSKIFQKLTEALSESARAELYTMTGAKYLTAHALRHTCAVIRMKQLIATGQSPEQAMAQLRSFFGWAKTSVMPLHYAKAALDERLNETWNDQLDDRLELLRALPQ
jgi:integrase